MKILPSIVAENLIFLREKKGWKRTELAEHVDKVDAAYLGHLERCELNPMLGTLRRIAEALDAELHSLFCLADDSDLLEVFLRSALPSYDTNLCTKDAFHALSSVLLDKLTLEDLERLIFPIRHASFTLSAGKVMLPSSCFAAKTLDLNCDYSYWNGTTNHLTFHDVGPDCENLRALLAVLKRATPDEIHLMDLLQDYIGT